MEEVRVVCLVPFRLSPYEDIEDGEFIDKESDNEEINHGQVDEELVERVPENWEIMMK